MDGLIQCTQIYRKRVAHVRIPRINLTAALRSGVTISSVGTATVSPTGLTVSGEATNGGTVEIDGVNVAAGKAITLTASGGTADVTYEISIPFTTSDGETMSVEGVRIVVLANLS